MADSKGVRRPKNKTHSAVLQVLAKFDPRGIVIVEAEFSDYLRPPPQDGRTYIIQDKRRPWLKHVSGPGINYTLDERDPKFQVSCYVNGKRIESKYCPKTKPQQVDKTKHFAASNQDAPSIRLIGIKRVEQISGFSKSYIYENCGHSFPQRISFGSSKRAASRWVESEVVAWATQQASSRNQSA